MPRRSLTLRIIIVALVAYLPVGMGAPAHAGVTSVTISPATWTPGSSQAFTLTMQISPGTFRYLGFWENNGTRTWTLSRTGSYNGTLSGTTLTCATTGVTYTSALFTGWGDGVKMNACYDDQDSSYFEIGANLNLLPTRFSISGPGTVVMSIPAGLLTAPDTEGTSVLQAIANPDPKTNFNAVVAASAPAPEATVPVPPTSHMQAVGLPVSGWCSDVDDADLAWGTGLTGGWTPSWGGWLNDGLGGVACSRSLVNVSGTQRWIIA